MVMIHDFIYKSQGKTRERTQPIPKLWLSRNFSGALQLFLYFMQSLKVIGGYQCPKSMANNKIQEELWPIKTKLSTPKYHLHTKAFPRCQKITLKNGDIALTKASSNVWRYILISTLFIVRKRALNISNSVKLSVNLISSPRWNIIGVDVWYELIKTYSGLQLSICEHFCLHKQQLFFRLNCHRL